MLEYYGIAESGGSNVNKNNSSPECIICITDTFSRYILDFSQTYMMSVMI